MAINPGPPRWAGKPALELNINQIYHTTVLKFLTVPGLPVYL